MEINQKAVLRRYSQIATTFTRYGFGAIVDKLGVRNPKERIKGVGKKIGQAALLKQSTGERLKLVLEELGPTFVKLGQLLATRPDILPIEIIQELEKLHDGAQAFSYDEVEKLIESEFGEKIEYSFRSFERVPIAAASIAQVHLAELSTGQKVAVKVQRPSIEENIHLDLLILRKVARIIEISKDLKEIYGFSEVVQEFEKMMLNELNFISEGENAERLRGNLEQDYLMHVPKTKWTYTTQKVLTMEYIEGIPLTEIEQIRMSGLNLNQIGQRLSESIGKQIFRDGFFHADPHPGNIVVNKDGKITFLDTGMVCALDARKKEIISELFVGVAHRDTRKIVRAFTRLDSFSDSQYVPKFKRGTQKIIDRYFELPWEEIKINKLFYDMFQLAHKNKIRIPHEFILIAKSLATIQGSLEKLAPELNALTISEPIATEITKNKLSIGKNISKVEKNITQNFELLNELPDFLLGLIEKISRDDYIVQFEIKEISKIQNRLDRTINRISISMVLLAISIVISGVIIASGLSAGTGREMYELNYLILRLGLVLLSVIITGICVSIFRSNR